MPSTPEALERRVQQIRDLLSSANKLGAYWDSREREPEEEELISHYVGTAFLELILLLEIEGLAGERERISALYQEAKKNFSKVEYSVSAGDIFLTWPYRLQTTLDVLSPYAPDSPAQRSAIARLLTILRSFSEITSALKERIRKGKAPLLMRDEYDVQHLLNGILRVQFEDIRPEESGPSVAGISARVDILLKNERVIIEVKRTRKSQSTSQLGKELIIDIGIYEERTDCDALIIFIHDPEAKVRNRKGFISDLQKKSSSKLKVIVEFS